MTSIRPARRDDGAALQAIERLAGERFREVGLDGVANDEPLGLDVLAGYADAGRSWVVVDERDEPVGYVVVDEVDGNAHVEQVSVHPEHQGRGFGRMLFDRVVAWGTARGLAAVTLTSFDAVPWNRPLYEHLGFEVVPTDGVGPELQALVAHEAAQGLDPAMRVCMRRRLP
ncbi:MAG TPA: GNAT family N-acetyltransferase [Acidimicrobiia bacterium]|nr:GNAT family N-acetyltransferase [Acidimicrobiia bacterium]